MNRYLKLTFVSTFLAVMCTNAVAEICWIIGVESAPDGVNVKFAQGDFFGSITLDTKDEKFERFRIRRGVVIREGEETNSLFLKIGQSASVIQGVHDQCRLTSAQRANQIGIDAEASFRPHGMPPSVVERFIPAK